MDNDILIIIVIAIFILSLITSGVYFRKNIGKYIKENPAESTVLLVILVTYITYQFHKYKETKKLDDIYQSKNIENTCPDYWVNVSKSRN